jgi:hypothetical protein
LKPSAAPSWRPADRASCTLARTWLASTCNTGTVAGVEGGGYSVGRLLGERATAGSLCNATQLPQCSTAPSSGRPSPARLQLPSSTHLTHPPPAPFRAPRPTGQRS